MEHRIVFPGWMERCCGFTIPEHGVFYAFYFEYNLARFDIQQNLAVEIEGEWTFSENDQIITVKNRAMPFLGVWGGRPLLTSEKHGQLTLSAGKVQLSPPSGQIKEWQFENFSGDWEYVTFDSKSEAFLFGTPYDFDFRYVELY